MSPAAAGSPAGQNNQGAAAPAGAGQHFVPNAQAIGGNLGGQPGNVPGTPTRQGQQPITPSVVISPSAPVSLIFAPSDPITTFGMNQ